jgi:HEPN domain-containing protein
MAVDLAQAFLSAARDDLRAAEACLRAGCLPACAFLAQQAGEKAAKAWLIDHGHPAGRTHYTTPALVRAVRALGEGEDGRLRAAVDALHDLEEYAAGARYPSRGPAPGSYETPGQRIDADEAAAALAQARAVLAALAADRGG